MDIPTDPDTDDRLYSVDLHPSAISERLLITLGHALYKALDEATRLDEVELLLDAIGEFSIMASAYGDKTNRVAESLGVDLNEAAIYKQLSLKDAKPLHDMYYKFSQQFIAELTETKNWLENNPVKDTDEINK